MNIEEMKKKREVLDTILDLLAETGDKQAICVSKTNKLNNKLREITTSKNKLNDEKYEGLINIIDQFNQVIDDFLKE